MRSINLCGSGEGGAREDSASQGMDLGPGFGAEASAAAKMKWKDLARGRRPSPPPPRPDTAPADAPNFVGGSLGRKARPPDSMRGQRAPSVSVPSNLSSAAVSASETLNSGSLGGIRSPQQSAGAGTAQERHENGFGAELPVSASGTVDPGLSLASEPARGISGGSSGPGDRRHSASRSRGKKRARSGELAVQLNGAAQGPAIDGVEISPANSGAMPSYPNQQALCPSSVAWPQDVSLESADPPLPCLQQLKGREGEDSVQRKLSYQRNLRRLQNQVKQKLKLWAMEAGIFQESDGGELGTDSQARLIISEALREAFVKTMVESCRQSKQLRESFLGAVQASSEVLHTSVSSLVSRSPSGEAQEVVNAWREMTSQLRGDSWTRIAFYNAVDVLHRQGEGIREKPNRPDEVGSECSLVKHLDGAWEVIIPGPHGKRVPK